MRKPIENTRDLINAVMFRDKMRFLAAHFVYVKDPDLETSRLINQTAFEVLKELDTHFPESYL